MSHTPDLTHAGVDAILAVLADAGVPVHYSETDGDTFLDVWLTDVEDATTATILSWRDNGEGWLLRTWESFGGDTNAQRPDRKWPITAGSPAEVSRDVATILANAQAEWPTPAAETGATPAEPDRYTVTMPDGFPWADRTLTIPAPHTADEIATVIRAELESVGYDGRRVDVDVQLAAGTVGIAYHGWEFSYGTITGPGVGKSAQIAAGASPQTDPTPVDGAPGLLLAAQLHRLADDIVRLGLPVPTCSGATSLHLGVLDSRDELEQWADYLGSEIAPGGTDGSIPKTEAWIQLTPNRWGPTLGIHAQIRPGPSETERLAARVAELEAQIAAQGGTR